MPSLNDAWVEGYEAAKRLNCMARFQFIICKCVQVQGPLCLCICEIYNGSSWLCSWWIADTFACSMQRADISPVFLVVAISLYLCKFIYTHEMPAATAVAATVPFLLSKPDSIFHLPNWGWHCDREVEQAALLLSRPAHRSRDKPCRTKVNFRKRKSITEFETPK